MSNGATRPSDRSPIFDRAHSRTMGLHGRCDCGYKFTSYPDIERHRQEMRDLSSDPVGGEPRHAHHDQGVDWDAVECLVDAAIRSGKITVSRGAEILGLQLRTWRERASEIGREGNPYA